MGLIAQHIADLVGGKLVGDPNAAVQDARPADCVEAGYLTFAVDARRLQDIPDGIAAVVVVPQSLEASLPQDSGTTYIVAADPIDAVMKAMDVLRPPRKWSFEGISLDAAIADSAEIGDGTTIYPGVHIFEDAVVGERCTLFPGVIIGAGCRIGNDVTLDPYVVVYPEVEVGDNVEIQAGAVLGGDGFRYETRQGKHERVRHCGVLKIGDDVEIGAGSTFDRAVLGETVVGDGTKIGNLVAVAHNCELGKHNLLVSQVGFAGSVTTGEYVVCAGQVGVGDHVHLGDGCVLGAKSGVHRDLEGGRTYLGAPAAPIEETTRQMMAIRRLPELRTTVRRLEKEVAGITRLLQSINLDEADDQMRDAA